MRNAILIALLFFTGSILAQPVFPPATQSEVNAGTATSKFVSPATLAGWTGTPVASFNGVTMQPAIISNHVVRLTSSGTVTLYGTNQSYEVNVTGGLTIVEDGTLTFRSNILYSLAISNVASAVSFPSAWRWIDGTTVASAPSCQNGSYRLNILKNSDGTNAWVAIGRTAQLKFGYRVFATTNASDGSITINSAAITNYSQGSTILINCSTDVTANITNTVASNFGLLFTNLVIGMSGSLGFVADATPRTLSVAAGPAITWMSTNDTSNLTNILTAATKRTLVAWKVGMGTDGYTTNLSIWTKNQSP